jgi:hypothetical protein
MLALMMSAGMMSSMDLSRSVDLSRVMAEVRAWKAHSDDSELDEALSQLVITFYECELKEKAAGWLGLSSMAVL